MKTRTAPPAKQRTVRAKQDVQPAISTVPDTKTGIALYLAWVFVKELGWLGLFLLLVVFSVTFYTRPISDSDYWHHMSLAREIAVAERPQTDTLSFTASGRPWVSSGWIPSSLLYQDSQKTPDNVHRRYLVWLMLGVTLFGISVYRPETRWALAFVILLMAAAAYPRFLPRPDLASILFILPLTILLVRYEMRPFHLHENPWGRAALLPLLFLVWVNCHMLFVIGLAIGGMFLVWNLWTHRGQAWPDRKFIVTAFLLSIAATFVNPYGYKVYWFILENARLADASSRINELKPLWQIASEPGGATILSFIGAWAAACGWLLWHQRGQVSLWRWIAIAFLAALALAQRRQIGLASFGISALVLTGASGNTIPPVFQTRLAVLLPVALFAGLASLSVSGKIPMAAPWLSKNVPAIDCNWFPCEAVDFLKDNPPPGHLFHDLYTGGYLGYHLAPDTKVFIDGRLEVFNNGTYDDFFAPLEGRMSLAQLFDKYAITSVFIDWRAAGQQPGHTAAALSEQSDWHLCWFSDHYALFVRSTGQSTAPEVAAAYINKHGYKYLNPLRPQRFMDALASSSTVLAAHAEARRAAADNPNSALAAKAMQVAGE